METQVQLHQLQQRKSIKTQQKQFEVTDGTVIIMIWRVIENMRNRGDDLTLQCLQNQQKLLHLSMSCLERKTMKAVPFNLNEQIVKFVQKINKVTMENFKDENQQIDLKVFSKAVDMLMLSYVHKYIGNVKLLGELKVLTFNNLACIYKKKKKYSIALRAVSFALLIEEHLVKDQASQQKYNIVTTYLNKAAILSEMGKHDRAIQQILKSKKFIDKIEKQVVKQINEATDTNLKKRLQQKRYYGIYMKMIINYNMGAEKEHMKLVQSAKQFYKTGKQLAIIIDNTYMIKKFDNILNKLP